MTVDNILLCVSEMKKSLNNALESSLLPLISHAGPFCAVAPWEIFLMFMMLFKAGLYQHCSDISMLASCSGKAVHLIRQNI